MSRKKYPESELRSPQDFSDSDSDSDSGLEKSTPTQTPTPTPTLTHISLFFHMSKGNVFFFLNSDTSFAMP